MRLGLSLNLVGGRGGPASGVPGLDSFILDESLLAGEGEADAAPTITSANTASVGENATLAHALTADEAVTWAIVGGADQARFEISGSTLRWLSNGTKNFESPDDANTDNAYVVTVRAVDSVGNASYQTITVTVTDVDEWQTAFTAPAYNVDSGGWNGFNIRCLVPAASISISGDRVRITLRAGSGAEGLVITNCTIGEKAGSGDAWDFASTPTVVTFGGGSASASTPGGGTIVSDAIDFVLDETKDYLVAAFINGGTANDTVRGNTGLGTHHFKSGSNDTQTVNATGYTTSATYRMVDKIEVA